MTSFFLSKATLRDDVTLADLRRHDLLSGNSYSYHRLVWNIMAQGSSGERNFLFRVDTSQVVPQFWILSPSNPAEFDNSLWDIRSKPFAPQLAKGDHLRFSLRCSPTRSVNTDVARTDGAGNKVRRVDVILEELRRARAANEIEPNSTARTEEIIYNAAASWLNDRREQLGFSLAADSAVDSFDEDEQLSLRVDSYSQIVHPKWEEKSRFRSREDFRTKAIKLSLLDISGTLIVNDVDLFLNTLTKGIGHGKAWGCGLMLIKRSRSL